MTEAGGQYTDKIAQQQSTDNMKTHIHHTGKLGIELVPPGCHCQNAAEITICNFKAHYLSVLARVDKDFPSSLWDQLLPQTKITTNLIRQSNATPNV